MGRRSADFYRRVEPSMAGPEDRRLCRHDDPVEATAATGARFARSPVRAIGRILVPGIPTFSVYGERVDFDPDMILGSAMEAGLELDLLRDSRPPDLARRERRL